MKQLIHTVLITSSLVALTACGGGGGSSNGNSGSSTANDNQVVTKSFTVGLSGVTISRVSNGDSLTVDTTGVNSTGSVTIN